jgi:hypothetical protein
MTKKSDKEELTWVEVTPETVTPPTDLLRVAELVFDTLRRGNPIFKDPELDTLGSPLSSLGEALSWDETRPEWGVLYQNLKPLERLPRREIIDARINYYMQEWQAGRIDDRYNRPAFLGGTLLEIDDVSRNTGIPVDELLRETDSREPRFITDRWYEDFNSDEPLHFYSEQFNPDGTLNERKANYISYAAEYYDDADGFFSDVFEPKVILGFVSPVFYVALSDEHLEACKKAFSAYMLWDANRDDDLFGWDDAPL